MPVSKKDAKSKKSNKFTLGRKVKTTELTVPSWADEAQTEHNVVLVKVPDPQALIGLGILDSYDSLSRLVGLKIDEIQGGLNAPEAKPEDIAKVANNMGDILKGVEMIDRIVEWMVVEPKVLRPVKRDERGAPILVEGKEVQLSASERDEDKTYTDEVDLDDKLFILQFAVGGDRNLDNFRTGTAALMGNLEDVQGVRHNAVGSA